MALLFCLTPLASSPIALVIGVLLASFGFVPSELPIASFTKKLLSYSIIGLGFGINFEQALAVTSDGIGLIIATITGTLLMGTLIARVIKLERVTAY
ncbi:putative sulfate exporter family transporter, partial [Vibrio parahaemolyticus]|nr:putative sulfate exporter family transporter [Vibrio parahaemolyticus]